MTIYVMVAVLVASGILYSIGRRLAPGPLLRTLVGSLLAVDGIVALAAGAVAALIWLGTPLSAVAAPLPQEGGGLSGNVAIGAALATGLAAIGAGIAVGIAGAAAIGAITEKPETLGRTLIFVGLAEGIAIYGLIISFMILTG